MTERGAAPAPLTAEGTGVPAAESPRTGQKSRWPPLFRRRGTAPTTPRAETVEMQPVAAQRDARKPARQLQFANTAVSFRPEDLPEEYEPGDEYRGLDAYLAARSTQRRQKRRQERRAALAQSQFARRRTEESDSDSDHSSSGSSSSSQTAQGGMARLRALFGDSDSSSSSSSSDSSDTESDGGTSLASGTTRSVADHDTDRMSVMSRRSRHTRNEGSTTDSPALPSALSAWTPRLGGRPGRRRRRRRKRRANREAVHMQKASRKARRNARRLREIAGGVTEYALYTPTAPGEDPLLRAQSWRAVQDRLHYYFMYYAQRDGHAGDLGAPSASDTHAPQASTPRQDDELDMGLPPPALGMPSEDPSFQELDDDQEWYERERSTGRHMSDVPLTPLFRTRPSTEWVSPIPFARTPGPARAARTPRSTVPTIAEEGTLDDLDAPLLGEPMLALPRAAKQSPRAPPIADVLPPPNPPAELRANPWWLDIHCPTYKDMQQLSLLFPLHPLTVEDILKQEPREKVESFDRLGYYFVAVRALDESYFRFTRGGKDPAMISPRLVEEQMDKARLARESDAMDEKMPGQSLVSLEICTDERSKEGLEGLNAGSVSMYLVVFAHGVLSFHFEDVRKHTDRVRSRLESHVFPADFSSEWIVHGLYDSIVDAFTPYVSFLRTQVGEIEALSNDLSISPFKEPEPKEKRPMRKPFRSWRRKAKPAQLDTHLDTPLGAMESTSNAKHDKKSSSFSTVDAVRQSRFIWHLSHTREIVTGLSRLLIPKTDVLRGFRKRLSDAETEMDESMIILYMDDIFDHVALMLVQLHDRENALSHTHNSFLARSQIANKRFQIGKIKYLLLAASVASGTLLCQLATSTFSMNVMVPLENQLEGRPHNSFYGFGAIIAFVGCVPFIIYAYYRLVKRLVMLKANTTTVHW